MAIAPRVPACSQQLVVHPDLVLDVADGFESSDLERVAVRLIPHAETLNGLGRQNFLYSGMTPPADLVGLLADALRSAGDGTVQADAPGAARTSALRPPQGESRAADTVLRLRSGTVRIRACQSPSSAAGTIRGQKSSQG